MMTANRTLMIAMTTSISIRVKPPECRLDEEIVRDDECIEAKEMRDKESQNEERSKGYLALHCKRPGPKA